MDPFTLALATFGVQKLRGKSTKRALRDAFVIGGGAYGIGALAPQSTVGSMFANKPAFSSLGFTSPGTVGQVGNVPQEVVGMEEVIKGPGIPPAGGDGGTNILQAGIDKFKGLSTPAKLGIGAAGITALGGLFGDDKETQYLPIPNQAYGKYARSGIAGSPTGFQVMDYQTGQATPMIADRQNYKVAEDILGDQPTQQFKAVEMNQGGLASMAKFNEGGQVLPSKFTHDETDVNNYERANGFVMDGTGNGKDHEDTMLAQLADGEFVSRSHAVLGAGIIAGASIKDKKEQRKKGAEFFYEQQKRFKRIFDIVNANRTDN